MPPRRDQSDFPPEPAAAAAGSAPTAATMEARAQAGKGLHTHEQDRRARPSRARRHTWLCGLCAREVTYAQMKRHLAAHDRRGASREDTDEEWMHFLNATGWPHGDPDA